MINAMSAPDELRDDVLRRCQAAIPSWRRLAPADFEFDDPKGFSSFTIGVRARRPLEPAAVLYRQLAGKTNAILDFDTERAVFLLLGEADIAARCLHYDRTCRIEAFYRGRTLTAEDVFDPQLQRGIANELYRLHRLTPAGLPDRTFFELLTERWGELARSVLSAARSAFPGDEQQMCADLEAITSRDTVAKVLRCLPDGAPVFCHNDTYHGNVFLLDDGSVKLLDFEFSCLNHVAFDFANLFAETVMEHGLADPPHFRIGQPRFTDEHLRTFIGFYLDNVEFEGQSERETALSRLLAETRRALLLSDYMYAMAALPLALEPIQRIRFIPYAHQRFHRFLDRWDAEFGQPQ
ncbi:MAG: phosphotransferase [Acidimicrobiia bacterium]|nr:phosphotransferase [Acidimicrobiia bacterium]